MTDLDLYAILEVTPGADAGAVERAYWRLVREHQRRVFVSPVALDRLNQAYEVLSTPSLRREYDESRLREAGHDNPVQSAEAHGATRFPRLWPRRRLRRLAKERDTETEERPSDCQLETAMEPENLTAAPCKVEGDHRSCEAEPLPRSEQLRLSTASLIERWRRTSRGVGPEEPVQTDR